MKRYLLSFLLFASLMLAACAMPTEPLPKEISARVIFLDVGQGDCTLVRTQKGDVLIDAGSEASQERLCKKLKALGVSRLELAIFTHPDEDHIGGADCVLAQFPAKEIWITDVEGEGEHYERFLQSVQACDGALKRIREGALCRVGDTVFFAFPLVAGNNLDTNANSLIVKLTCGEATALFTGDAGAEIEARLVERYGRTHLDCDLYKVGHHGADTSTSQALLDAMQPTQAVISCGAGNVFGHPHGATLRALKAAGVTVYRTDRMGDVVFDSDGKEWIPQNTD